MVRTAPSAGARLIREFREARDFLPDLPDGRYDFTSRGLSAGYNLQAESTDWYFATGGYSVWGKGRAQVQGAGAARRYDVDFTYKFYDRYNWDGGKEVVLAGIRITDEFMGEFHRQGLAREYNCYGMLRRRFTWTGDLQAPGGSLLIHSGGR